MVTGADPGFRRGGGVRTFRRGGGVRTGISGADPNCCRALGKSTSKQKLQTAVGGGGVRSPKKAPVSAPGLPDLTTTREHEITSSYRISQQLYTHPWNIQALVPLDAITTCCIFL